MNICRKSCIEQKKKKTNCNSVEIAKPNESFDPPFLVDPMRENLPRVAIITVIFVKLTFYFSFFLQN